MTGSSNLELVRSIFVAWEHGDFTSAGWADDEIEYVQTGSGPAPGTWTGQTGMGQTWKAWLDAWDAFRAHAEEYRELDDESVLALARISGRGKASGLEMDTKAACLFRVREGGVVRLELWTSRDRALADLGLGHETG
jgi:ketosteroid isomerase-like protein